MQKKIVGLGLEVMRPLLEGLLKNMDGGVFTIDLDKKVAAFNKAAEWITGYCFEDVIDQPCAGIMRSNLCTEGCVFEKVMKTSIPVKRSDVVMAGKEGNPLFISYSAFRLDDVHGQARGMTVIFRDLTEIKNLREQIVQTEKLAVMGQLAAGVAHEINNPINGIITYIHLFLKRLDENRIDPAVFKKDLKLIERETTRIGRLVKNLLNFSRKAEPDLRAVSVPALIDETLHLLEDQFLLKNINITRRYDADLPDILADFNQFQQVVVNLVLNAIQAVEKQGLITISLCAEGRKGSECFVIMNITDNGVGIPDEDIDRIFDPFYTTKTGEKGGIGLGLTIVQQIVRAHHGRITVKSKPGEGTAVSVRLPTL